MLTIITYQDGEPWTRSHMANELMNKQLTGILNYRNGNQIVVLHGHVPLLTHKALLLVVPVPTLKMSGLIVFIPKLFRHFHAVFKVTIFELS